MEKQRNNFFIDSLLAVDDRAVSSGSDSSRSASVTAYEETNSQTLKTSNSIRLDANFDAFYKYYKFYRTEVDGENLNNELVLNFKFLLFFLFWFKFSKLNLRPVQMRTKKLKRTTQVSRVVNLRVTKALKTSRWQHQVVASERRLQVVSC